MALMIPFLFVFHLLSLATSSHCMSTGLHIDRLHLPLVLVPPSTVFIVILSFFFIFSLLYYFTLPVVDHCLPVLCYVHGVTTHSLKAIRISFFYAPAYPNTILLYDSYDYVLVNSNCLFVFSLLVPLPPVASVLAVSLTLTSLWHVRKHSSLPMSCLSHFFVFFSHLPL